MGSGRSATALQEEHLEWCSINPSWWQRGEGLGWMRICWRWRRPPVLPCHRWRALKQANSRARLICPATLMDPLLRLANICHYSILSATGSRHPGNRWLSRAGRAFQGLEYVSMYLRPGKLLSMYAATYCHSLPSFLQSESYPLCGMCHQSWHYLSLAPIYAMHCFLLVAWQ